MEFWKDIKGFEGYYQVSNLGNLKGLDRHVKHNYGGYALRKSKLLKPNIQSTGYFAAHLKMTPKYSCILVHRIVAEAFIPNPENKPQVNHINAIKTDNRVENLEWCTSKENIKHSHIMGLQSSESRQGEKNNFAKLTEKEVLSIRDEYNSKDKITHQEIGLKYGVSGASISNIVLRKTWKHV